MALILSSEKSRRVLGYSLLVFWVFQAAVRLYYSRGYDLLWYCDIILLASAFALIADNDGMILAAFLGSAFVDAAWIIDVSAFLVSGHFLFTRVADYLLQSNWISNLATSYHAFLAIMLLLSIRRVPRHAWIWATGIFAAMQAIGYALGPVRDVNGVYTQLVVSWSLPPLVRAGVNTLIFAIGFYALNRALIHISKRENYHP